MSREHIYDPTEGEFVDFETLADWEQRDKAKDARIEALERQVKAADALAEAIRRTGYRVDHNGVTTLTGMDSMIPINDALAAYRATKEGGA